MAKKVIRLTENELNQLIKEATSKVLNEMDAATYSRIHNASHRAMQDIQNGNFQRSVYGTKMLTTMISLVVPTVWNQTFSLIG